MPRLYSQLCALALLLTAGACASHQPLTVMPVATTESAPAPADQPDEPLIGPGAADTFGGWLPDGQTLSTQDVSSPVLSQLDPMLLRAIQDAAAAAAADGVDLRVSSGWRSVGFQQRLFDDAVRKYGSAEIASQFVASPEASKHVVGKAVDIAPNTADDWLIRNGPRFGLCQIYANEIWHFELATDDAGRCPPLRPNAAG